MTQRIEVEALSSDVNAPVLRIPGRRFPGVLIQGDALHALCGRVDALCAAASSAPSDLAEAALEIRDILEPYRRVYDAAANDDNAHPT